MAMTVNPVVTPRTAAPSFRDEGLLGTPAFFDYAGFNGGAWTMTLWTSCCP